MFIYKTTNLINKKIYIGLSTKDENIEYFGSGLILLRAIKKYGKENFKREIIEFCDSIEFLKKREIFWIKKLKSAEQNIGYNISKGGIGGYLGVEASKKISIATSLRMKGNVPWNAGKKALNKGVLMSEEQKKKLRKPKSEEHKNKLSIIAINRTNKKILCLNNSKVYDTGKQAAIELNLTAPNITAVLKKRINHTKGYKFEYYMKKNIFLTATLPYASIAGPHVGHMFEFVFCDVIARYLRKENNVFFNLGLDEHGNKIYNEAINLGLKPKELVDGMTIVWKEFCTKFNISYDNFYKTSSLEHAEKVQEIWNKWIESGDLYKKKYTGLYCNGCESYKTEKDLINGKCPDHDKDGMIISIEEENYFFKFSKYKQSVREYISKNLDFLQPFERRKELLNLIQSSEDISVSRLKKNCPWGVQVPNDPDQVMYCWLEALLNYIFAAEVGTEDSMWHNVIQVCGPDNLRFQGFMFQCFLKALDVPHTNKLLVHGTILDDKGRKMSKTEGNTVDPIDQLDKYGVDAVRYYAVAGVNNYDSSAWIESDLVNKFNAEICDDWGNLVSRVLHLVDTKTTGWLPWTTEMEDTFYKKLVEDFKEYDVMMKEFDLSGAFRKLNQIVKFGNNYVNETKPWTITDEATRRPILSNLLALVHYVNDAYVIVFPERCGVISKANLDQKKVIAFSKIQLCSE